MKTISNRAGQTEWETEATGLTVEKIYTRKK
jgi:hypothetical protein